ncbi:flagellar assembly protein FliH [Trinickia mobilis]|uniref:flagellar assembly protein FliH n=1 Tax=Trinickia mobilis TaxID=2816356 RepID=UPI001A8F4F17|nr:flagellar assembly protein FliH [Trinickia mobilis]
MRRYVPYRFPPLTSVSPAVASTVPGAGRGDDPDLGLSVLQDDAQAASARGYEAGFERGEIEGRNTGFARGQEEGLRQGADEAKRAAQAAFEGVAHTADGLVAALKQLQAEFAAALHTELIDLVEKVARQVIRCELTAQPAQLLALIDEAVATLPPVTDPIEIYLQPQACERIAALAPERAQAWNLIADARLELGECRIKAGGREIDAGCKQRLDTCMEQVREQLLPERNVEAHSADDAAAPAQEGAP